ncbi:hypothetical protein EMCRGX_G018021 [Ephydatia muelleri]
MCASVSTGTISRKPGMGVKSKITFAVKTIAEQQMQLDDETFFQQKSFLMVLELRKLWYKHGDLLLTGRRVPSGISAKAAGWIWEGPKVAARRNYMLVEYFYYAGKADGIETNIADNEVNGGNKCGTEPSGHGKSSDLAALYFSHSRQSS